jgi:hypothetical protein
MSSQLSTVYPECRQIYPVLPKVMDEWKNLLENQAELQAKVERLEDAIRQHKRRREGIERGKLIGTDLDHLLWAILEKAKAERGNDE